MKRTVAVVQATPVVLDLGASVEKACGLVAEAAERGAEIDLTRTREERLTLDTGGHYARPDLFRFEVDRRRLDSRPRPVS